MLAAEVRPWHVIIQDSLAASAFEVARELIARLSNKELIDTAIQLVPQQSISPEIMQWKASSLATGNAGLALVYAQLDQNFPGEAWDQVAHHHLHLAAQEISLLPHHPIHLFGGLSGLTFASWSLSHDGRRYQRLLATLDQRLLPKVRDYVAYTLEQRQGVPVGLYDVVSGLAGVGVSLLSRRNDPEILQSLHIVLECLITLAQEEDGAPRWHTPSHFSPQEDWQELYPTGFVNCGLAHGIPGPLVLLSLAKLHGIQVAGLEAAIQKYAEYLFTHHSDDEWGINWPVAFPINSTEIHPEAVKPARAAWCYGAPGVARALWLAGKALDHTPYREMALAAMQAVYRRPLAVRFIDSPSFCHGIAGLLQITLRFAHDSDAPCFVEAANALVEQLLALYMPDSLLGFRNMERPGVYVDQPSLLDGIAGILLVLLAASTKQEPIWDRVFLLA